MNDGKNRRSCKDKINNLRTRLFSCLLARCGIVTPHIFR